LTFQYKPISVCKDGLGQQQRVEFEKKQSSRDYNEFFVHLKRRRRVRILCFPFAIFLTFESIKQLVFFGCLILLITPGSSFLKV
jgi:hypothetical protein